MNLDEYQLIALYIFYCANRLMFLRDISEIERDVSERSFCANLKEFINLVLSHMELSDYVADVEYNRGGDKLIKAICHNNEDKPITCDLIIHSRGKLKDDNLLCVEVKKKGNNYKIDEDRERLIELTKQDLVFKHRNNDYYFVNGYKLGIFYIYDYQQKVIELEFYSQGKHLHNIILRFDKFINGNWGEFISMFAEILHPRSRNITFYNMGFGDSFLIKDGSNRLLVDCGSSNVDNSIWASNKVDIFAKMFFSKNNLLITHYHMDHLNKLKELSDMGLRFDNIYVRNINNCIFEFDITNFFFELVNYSYTTGDYNSLIFWLNPSLLFKLLKAGGKVTGVNNKVNNLFRIGRSRAEVLWPEPTIKIPKIDIENVLAAYPTCLKHLKTLIRLYNSLANIGADNTLAALDNLINEGISFNDEVEEAIIKEVIEIAEDPKYKQIRNSLSDLENKLSIVFSIDDAVLMCGDATRRSLTKALASKKGVKYSIIKVPHHGTSKYTNKRIHKSASTFLIPNSKHFRKRVIDSSYTKSSNCECLNCSVASACLIPCHKHKILPRKSFLF